MTVDELIETLQALSADGYGESDVLIDAAQAKETERIGFVRRDESDETDDVVIYSS